MQVKEGKEELLPWHRNAIILDMDGGDACSRDGHGRGGETLALLKDLQHP